MNYTSLILVIILFLFTNYFPFAQSKGYAGEYSSSETLKQRIESYVIQQQSAPIEEIVVTYKNKLPLLTCDEFHITLMNKNRRWGNINVVVQCEKQKLFIPIHVKLKGKYLIAVQPIAAGHKIEEKDVAFISGNLEKFPETLITDSLAVIDQVALRNIAINQPLTQNMLRRHWLIQTGQTVQVVTFGEGFSISGEGKALNNGAENETIRIRMNNGTLISGLVLANGSVQLM